MKFHKCQKVHGLDAIYVKLKHTCTHGIKLKLYLQNVFHKCPKVYGLYVVYIKAHVWHKTKALHNLLVHYDMLKQ